MGLDMYAFATRTAPATPVDFKADDSQELAYWRKHPNLHGWMHQLYDRKGGSESYFNVCTVRLTHSDLDELEHAQLPETDGFFFGKSYPEDYERDKVFIKLAREALNQGLSVYYYAWY